jgi:hypothetical protein
LQAEASACVSGLANVQFCALAILFIFCLYAAIILLSFSRLVCLFTMNTNGLCKWSAGLKVMNFQLRTEPIRLFIISFFPSIVKDELAVLQQRAAAELTVETRITFTFC